MVMNKVDYRIPSGSPEGYFIVEKDIACHHTWLHEPKLLSAFGHLWEMVILFLNDLWKLSRDIVNNTLLDKGASSGHYANWNIAIGQKCVKRLHCYSIIPKSVVVLYDTLWLDF